MPKKIRNGLVGDPVGDVISRDEGAKGGTAESYSHRIRSLEALLRAAQTDLAQWKVERHVINKWEVGAKHPKTGQILIEPLWQVKAWLVPRPVEAVDVWGEALEAFSRRLRGWKPSRPRKRRQRGKARYALEIAIFDLHLGKLAWGPETGDAHWDVKITQSAFLDAVAGHLEWWRGYAVEQIYFPFGQDFFQVDTLHNETTAGTVVDVDTRPARTISIGCELMFRAVEMMAAVAPVHLIPTPGNHDEQRTLWLAQVMAAAYKRDRRVSIDLSAETLKCIEYGCNLIGYAHGKNEKPEKLMHEMPRRWPEAWARTTDHEWHTGHLHKRRNLLVEGDEEHQIRHRTLSSLCPPDAWHAQNLYYSKRASESILWSRTHGYTAHHSRSAAACA